MEGEEEGEEEEEEKFPLGKERERGAEGKKVTGSFFSSLSLSLFKYRRNKTPFRRKK